MKNFSFIIVAGGSGSRMGGVQKQFLKLGARQVWEWSARAAEKLEAVKEIILVIPEGQSVKFNSTKKFITVTGGTTRPQSVLNGLKNSSCDFVMIHDAARPFISENLLHGLMNNTYEHAGAIPVLPVSDALKKIDSDGINIINREGIYITQTPQCFYKSELEKILTQYNNVKDEAEAWLNAGKKLNYIDGERLNFKITWPEDMNMARALIAGEKIITRSGIGYDVHKLTPGRKLILGGVEIKDSPVGLLGHSDADILTHAVMDAVLGAAGLPDIGNLFPASDEKYKGASSLKLFQEVLRLVNDNGWSVDYVDAVIEAQIPRLNKYMTEIKDSLKNFAEVNLKFKSAEEIDDAGLGLAMKAWAVAQVSRND